MAKPWIKYHARPGEIGEVMPLEDAKPHVEGPLCECRPFIVNGKSGGVLVHNSYDRREFTEPAELVASDRRAREAGVQ